MMRIIAILCLTGCATQNHPRYSHQHFKHESKPKLSTEASNRIYEISDESKNQQ